jgi:hypothetical protein
MIRPVVSMGQGTPGICRLWLGGGRLNREIRSRSIRGWAGRSPEGEEGPDKKGEEEHVGDGEGLPDAGNPVADPMIENRAAVG